MKSSRLRKRIAWFMAMAMVLSFINPQQEMHVSAAGKKYVKTLSVPANVTVEQGTSTKVNVKVKVANKATSKVSVKVKNKKIAKVSYKASKNTIIFKGVKEGTTKVTVMTKGKNKAGKKLKKVIKVNVVKKGATVTPAPSPTPSPTPAPAPTPVVKVTSIILSSTNLELMKGSKARLTATVQPDNAADKSISWSSSNTSVVKVSSDGELTLLAGGTAVITATNKISGVSASCMVTVLDTITVTTQSQLEQALKNANVGKIILNPVSGQNISIPSGNYSDTVLIVKGDASFTNAGSFKSIELQSGTYTEKSDNDLIITGKSSVTVGKGVSCGITVNMTDAKKEDTVTVKNDGAISSINISSAGTVRISGDSEDTINLNISAADVKFVSNQNVKASLTAPAEIVLTGDVEDTAITIDKPSSMPKIYGVGNIEVTNKETGEKTYVLAETSDELGKVTVEGKVVDAYDSDSALSGVTVYLVSAKDVSADADVDTILENAKNYQTSDEEGEYNFIEITEGNYYFLMLKEGYKPAIQFAAISARYNTTYTNETMQLLKEDGGSEKTATLSGTVKDAANKEAVEGLTVELRKNKGNVTGAILQTVTTDSTGTYKFTQLEADQYTVRVVDNRKDIDDDYISNSANVCVKKGTDNSQDVVVSKAISGSGIRFVLTWGSEQEGVPEDLDSHLYGPSLAGTGMHEVYYGKKEYGLPGETYTSLDVDETEYNGPETMTINTPISGTYYYYVYNYSFDDDYNQTGVLYKSQAKVQVYAGNELLTTFNVPSSADATGRWWKVCSYNSATGKITSFNKIEEEQSVMGLNGEPDGDSSCEHGVTSYVADVVGESVTLTDIIKNDGTYDEYQDEYVYDKGSIKLYGMAAWNDIKDEISYEIISGYTAEFIPKTEDDESDSDDYQGQLIIKKNTKQVYVYDVFYSED